jgi:translation initiation factor 3 subunit B
MENGYHLYTFSGQLLREEPTEQFKQFTWRPRPERLLNKAEMKEVRSKLRDYSKQFEELDNAKRSTADKAIIEERRSKLEEWLAWRDRTSLNLIEERDDAGLEELSEERQALVISEEEGEGDGAKVVEEIFEEILEETEEILE